MLHKIEARQTSTPFSRAFKDVPCGRPWSRVEERDDGSSWCPVAVGHTHIFILFSPPPLRGGAAEMSVCTSYTWMETKQMGCKQTKIHTKKGKEPKRRGRPREGPHLGGDKPGRSSTPKHLIPKPCLCRTRSSVSHVIFLFLLLTFFSCLLLLLLLLYSFPTHLTPSRPGSSSLVSRCLGER